MLGLTWPGVSDVAQQATAPQEVTVNFLAQGEPLTLDPNLVAFARASDATTNVNDVTPGFAFIGFDPAGTGASVDIV